MVSESYCLTIVTVVRNDADALAATLDSVAAQRRDGVEHLIVDGASDDATTAMLDRARQTQGTRVVSEPDRGIYDAMNKGWHLAQGRYVQYLNAGDVFASDDEAAWAVARLTDTHDEWLRTRVRFVADDGRATRPLPSVAITRRFWWGWQPVLHQGAFMSRDLLQQLDGFAENLRIVGDYDLMQRALAAGVVPVTDARVTVDVDAAGVSTQRWRDGLVEMHRSRVVGRSVPLRTASALDMGTHVAVVGVKRTLRRGAERILGERRVSAIRS